MRHPFEIANVFLSMITYDNNKQGTIALHGVPLLALFLVMPLLSSLTGTAQSLVRLDLLHGEAVAAEKSSPYEVIVAAGKSLRRNRRQGEFVTRTIR